MSTDFLPFQVHNFLHTMLEKLQSKCPLNNISFTLQIPILLQCSHYLGGRPLKLEKIIQHLLKCPEGQIYERPHICDKLITWPMTILESPRLINYWRQNTCGKPCWQIFKNLSTCSACCQNSSSRKVFASTHSSSPVILFSHHFLQRSALF